MCFFRDFSTIYSRINCYKTVIILLYQAPLVHSKTVQICRLIPNYFNYLPKDPLFDSYLE